VIGLFSVGYVMSLLLRDHPCAINAGVSPTQNARKYGGIAKWYSALPDVVVNVCLLFKKSTNVSFLAHNQAIF